MAAASKTTQLLGKLLEDIDIAMLTTVGKDGYLVSRPLSTQKSTFDGRRVWFFTEADSPKVAEIRRNPKVNLAYASKDKNTYVSLSGKAGINRDPAPYVRQTALGDFYVEYRLIAHSPVSDPTERINMLSGLHANIQDVFNEHGVQIMSPHYMTDPAEAQVVSKDRWYTPPAKPPTL